MHNNDADTVVKWIPYYHGVNDKHRTIHSIRSANILKIWRCRKRENKYTRATASGQNVYQKEKMTLSDEDGKLYYQLWLPLLEYVNQKHGISKTIKRMTEAKNLDPAEVKKISDKMIDDVSVIDEYLSVNPGLSEENHEIIEGWKRSIRETFAIERHLKGGSIFISLEDENVYQVSGIITSVKEMFCYAPLPLIVKATLMPFRNMIITDGLIMTYSLRIGGNRKRTLKDVYMSAKRNGEIKKSL